ncbi:MAG: molybdopterin-guanine dinucleotide biosynthesis protein B [Candidatus Eremiobacterota bacterium]
MIPAVALVGRSGSGKTWVLERLAAHLRARGLRVGALKHTHHPVAGQSGDTLRLAEAGAAPVALAGPSFLVWYEPVALADALRLFHGKADLVLVEGYKTERVVPRIEVVRDAEPMLNPSDLWACVSDTPLPGVDCYPFLELDRLAERILCELMPC